ncbi:hypothetical protein ACHAXR_005366 [Thalassiosira sp. AJA248-18]
MANNNSGIDGASLSQSDRKKKNELLCIVSGFGYVPPSSAAAAAVADYASPVQTESSIIESIRHAASTIQHSTRGSRFEVTDQSGNLVPMRQSDSVAFLAALGLHRIGRSKMEKQDIAPRMDGGGSGGAISGDGCDSGRRDDIASALVFLLEADAEWNNSPALGNWREKVDNYGLLQLDIAWCYLLLENLDGLTDAVRRLGIAEKVLRKQVHTNFVTLALVQAEMNNPISPICVIFVRLFLLQGVANKMQNCNTTAAERLGWARLLCNRLRSSSPQDSVDTLCSAYLVGPPTAIAALRRSNGDPDAAGNLITLDRNEEKKAANKRRRQHKIGKCANGTDFVNLDAVSTLSSLLGYDVVHEIGTDNEEDDDVAFGANLSTSTLIVIGLLRLSNNVIDKSLELYNSIGVELVLERVARLDEASGRRKRRSTSSEHQKPTEHEVQDVDLTVLISMGVNETTSRDALKATGNVESALLWLCKDDDDNVDGGGDAKKGAKTSEEAASANDNDTSKDPAPLNQAEETEINDAHELLERELGNALSADSKQLLEKEWLGVDMKNEWDLIQKYI